MTYDVTDFQKDVIESSFGAPVLVDFWAPWCGPCRVLGPTLEKLAAENAGSWKLVKVNTDEYQHISGQYGIRGIPAVKLFVDGEVVNEFTGALPEHALRRWLDEAIPSEEKMAFEAAKAALDAGQLTMAQDLLRGLLAAQPSHGEARVLLARATALDDIIEAGRLLDGVEIADPALFSLIEDIKVLARLAQRAEDESPLPDEAGRDAYHAGIEAVAGGEWGAALAAFIDVIHKNRFYDDDGSRKACIAIFNLLGPAHELTRKHRRMFDMVLY
jgi:putative thioredoxin